MSLGQEIRLIVVMPGEPTDRLLCEIVHVNLAENPQYQAVSYTWATEEGDVERSCNVAEIYGGRLRVTVNCESALRQLRKSGLKRLLWIDSLCINQAHISERNHQVGLMDQIYSRADRVLICIQDPNYSYSGLFKWLREGDCDPNELTNFHKWATARLFASRYFNRVWVIQDVALAKTVFLIVNYDSTVLSGTVLRRWWKY